MTFRMSLFKRTYTYLFITITLGIVTALNCFANDIWTISGLCFNRFYVVPVILAAIVFRIRGGIIVSVIATLLILLQAMLGWHIPHFSNTIIEIVLFYMVSLLVGHMMNQFERNQLKNHQMEQTLERSERLSSLGTLVAGIAHEIRNPLAIIQITTETLEEKIDPADELKQYTSVLKEEINRLNKVLHEFLDFTQPKDLSFSSTSVHQTLEKVLRLSNKYLKEHHIYLHTNFQAKYEVISSAPDRLKQIFLNLIINAVEAMPTGGDLYITTESNADDISIHIKDTGIGMSPDTMKRAFEPFYTTKETGTGLGLSIVSQIISLHQGHIHIQSERNKGTMISLRFPLLYDKKEGASHAA
ncbi:ATP-binding protein [Microaerobacter geothermalis]|uniref:sensor histidine kinase n=1 Tax=Microaerobacter geothermalis TaxID=674972 RepID=UPI001F2888EC|nr:ATP-binding protein [Microaerobacter geothermalis]MCF6092776.1 ATP-binding protein [Microaerobacter geothermalis]